MLALVLQILAPILPSAAMAQAMELAAATPDEAASFAATCLGFGRPDTAPGADHPGTDHQAKCPICLSVAQSQGFSPASAPVVTSFAWTTIAQVSPAGAPAREIAASAFASRAPPAA